ncbi:uncharacterized protein LOC134336347 isoform X2 [Trichomycterus rosablanca]
MHRTTFSLGDHTTTYSTIHTESFSGRSRDGQPLVFLLRDPKYPSQHYYSLDLSNVPKGPSYTLTHSREVHDHKEVTPHDVLQRLRTRNWMHNCEGLAVKEVANPPEDTPYRSFYHSDHCIQSASTRPANASGQPTHWHHHDIITGEEKAPAGPGKPGKVSLEKRIWPVRRWETDCTGLRLY